MSCLSLEFLSQLKCSLDTNNFAHKTMERFMRSTSLIVVQLAALQYSVSLYRDPSIFMVQWLAERRRLLDESRHQRLVRLVPSTVDDRTMHCWSEKETSVCTLTMLLRCLFHSSLLKSEFRNSESRITNWYSEIKIWYLESRTAIQNLNLKRELQPDIWIYNVHSALRTPKPEISNPNLNYPLWNPGSETWWIQLQMFE